MNHPRRSHRDPRRPSGVVLIVALVLLLVVLAIGLASLRSVGEQARSSQSTVDAAKAAMAAERGAREAIDALLTGTISDTSPTDIAWQATGSGPATVVDHSYGFTIRHQTVLGAGGTEVVATTGTGAPVYRVVSEGRSGAGVRRVELALALVRGALWTNALTGCRGVTLDSNARTDSYHSSGTAAGTEGDVVSLSGDLRLDSNADIDGDVRVAGNLVIASNGRIRRDARVNGSIAAPARSIGGNAYAGGSISTNAADGTESPFLSPVPFEAEACDPLNVVTRIDAQGRPIQTSNDNAEFGIVNPAYVATSGNKTLGANGQSKRFYFSSLTLDSNSALTIRGDVSLYVSGNLQLLSNSEINLASGARLTVYLSGGFVMDSNTDINFAGNTPGIPSRVMIYADAVSTSRDQRIWLKSNAALSALLYAPLAHVELDSNAGLRGAARGRWVDFNSNGTYWYDEALRDVVDPSSPIVGYQLVYWKEAV